MEFIFRLLILSAAFPFDSRRIIAIHCRSDFWDALSPWVFSFSSERTRFWFPRMTAFLSLQFLLFFIFSLDSVLSRLVSRSYPFEPSISQYRVSVFCPFSFPPPPTLVYPSVLFPSAMRKALCSAQHPLWFFLLGNISLPTSFSFWDVWIPLQTSILFRCSSFMKIFFPLFSHYWRWEQMRRGSPRPPTRRPSSCYWQPPSLEPFIPSSPRFSLLFLPDYLHPSGVSFCSVFFLNGFTVLRPRPSQSLRTQPSFSQVFRDNFSKGHTCLFKRVKPLFFLPDTCFSFFCMISHVGLILLLQRLRALIFWFIFQPTPELFSFRRRDFFFPRCQVGKLDSLVF